MKWFTLSWYKYLFTPWLGFKVLFCRIKGHPNGPIYFNPGGLEPNWKCKDCGEDIG
jgi:hypothetical protein